MCVFYRSILTNIQILKDSVNPIWSLKITVQLQTFCTWLISSCLRFWLRVILRSVPSLRSVIMIDMSLILQWGSSNLLLKSNLSISTHSSKRRLTVNRINLLIHYCKAMCKFIYQKMILPDERILNFRINVTLLTWKLANADWIS